VWEIGDPLTPGWNFAALSRRTFHIVTSFRLCIPPLVFLPHLRQPLAERFRFRVDTCENPDTVWLRENPAPELERVAGLTRASDIDPEFRRFFTKDSISEGRLLHQEYRTVKTVVRIPRKEVGGAQGSDLVDRLKLPERTELFIEEELPEEDI
jgi:hypothetical protein